MTFTGSIAGAVLSTSQAPPTFSTCVIDCLESLTADTSVAMATIFSTDFDVTTRTIELIGPAPPADFEAVLRSLEYVNLAPNINVAAIQLQISDHINSSTVQVGVQQGMRRRRSTKSHSNSRAPIRYLFSFHESRLTSGNVNRDMQ